MRIERAREATRSVLHVSRKEPGPARTHASREVCPFAINGASCDASSESFAEEMALVRRMRSEEFGEAARGGAVVRGEAVAGGAQQPPSASSSS